MYTSDEAATYPTGMTGWTGTGAGRASGDHKCVQ